MTPFFVKQFKKDLKCASCPAKKLKGHSLCPYHLRLARERFASWSSERRSVGKCLSCNRKAFNGWLRCKVHTKINREACQDWLARNPDYKTKQWEHVKREYRSKGLCAACKEHRPAVEGRAKCAPCLERTRLIRNGLMAPWQGTFRELRKV